MCVAWHGEVRWLGLVELVELVRFVGCAKEAGERLDRERSRSYGTKGALKLV